MKPAKRIANIIERTDNPMAPVIIQRAHTAIEAFGKLMTNEADKQTVQSHCEMLLSKYSFDDMDTTAADPSFVMALCSLLASSIEFYTQAEKPRQ